MAAKLAAKAKKSARILKAPAKVESKNSRASAGPASKADKKLLAKGAPAPITAAVEGSVDPDEAEEAADAANASAASAGGNAAAVAAAGSTEMSASFKNFRHHPDMENFYRFIYENDLRLEARVILDELMSEKTKRRALRQARAQAH